MSRRAKIAIAVIVALLLVLAVLVYLALQPAPVEQPPVNGNQPATNQNANSGGLLNGGGTNFNVNLNQPANVNVAPPPPAVVDDRAGIKIVAKSFAELFGSFSTEGNYQNIVDAEFYMTDTVKTWAEGYVAEQRALPRSGEFAGTTTRAIFDPDVTIFDKNLGTATVTVKTRRIETGSTIGSQSVYYQDLTLEFLKIGDAWKVNRFTWGPK